MAFKIALIGIAVCLVSAALKKYSGEFILPIEIVYVCFALVVLLDIFNEITDTLSDFFSTVSYGEEVLSSVIKGMGICLLTKFSSDICLENGNKLVADVVEFSGRIVLMAIALPYIEAVISVALAFLK